MWKKNKTKILNDKSMIVPFMYSLKVVRDSDLFKNHMTAKQVRLNIA